MSLVGTRQLRTEDQRMLTSGAQYVADLRFENQAHACFVRSTVAHGRLRGVDSSEARSVPGVLGVFTDGDLGLGDLKPTGVVNQQMSRPLLARDTVRFVGEPIAAVVAETAAIAADAAELVVVDIEPLDVVATVSAAATGDTLVHESAGTNLAFDMPISGAAVSGATAELDFSECEVTVQASFINQRLAAVPLEPRSAAALWENPSDSDGVGDSDTWGGFDDRGDSDTWDDPDDSGDSDGWDDLDDWDDPDDRGNSDGWDDSDTWDDPDDWDSLDTRIIFYASTQAPHRVRDTLADVYVHEPPLVRVVTPDVGGGFGAKGTPSPEELLIAGLSWMVRRPLTWTESRAENLVGSVHGRAQHQQIRLGGTRDGHITHYELDVTQDAGAYPMIGAFLPTFTRKVFTGCYDIANASVTGRSYVTNTAPIAAYRGAGRPEAIFAIERAVDLYAARVGMDPAEVRRLNFVSPQQFPYVTCAGSVYDTGDFGAALEQALDAANYRELRNEQARRRDGDDPVLLGVGIASYVESTSMGNSELGEIELAGDGTLIVRTGATPFGQGHATCWAMIVSEITGVPMNRIRVISGDTDEITSSQITAGSRSAQLAGSAMHTAAQRLVDLARARVAALLEANEQDVVFDTNIGAFHVVGSSDPRVSWPQLAAEIELGRLDNSTALAATSDFTQEANTYAFGCHVAVVEVDSSTGAVSLRDLIACDDAGTLINPLIAEGQVQGGIAQGVAQALLEAVVYDPEANPLTASLADYAAVSAADLPGFRLVPMQTPTPLNPLGAKGIGESGTVGAGPAVLNAICDAVAHLGVPHIDMPATPQRVWRALRMPVASV